MKCRQACLTGVATGLSPLGYTTNNKASGEMRVAYDLRRHEKSNFYSQCGLKADPLKKIKYNIQVFFNYSRENFKGYYLTGLRYNPSLKLCSFSTDLT